MPFGKYKGKTIRSILADDPSYILWINTNTDVKLAPAVISQARKDGFEQELVRQVSQMREDFDYDDPIQFEDFTNL